MNIEEIKKKVLEIDPFCDINFHYLETILTNIDQERFFSNWRSHIEWWEADFGQKDKKWLKSDERNQRKDPIQFIEEGLNDRDWNVQKTHMRDNYLFPQHLPINQLYEFIRAVKEKIKSERENTRTPPS